MTESSHEPINILKALSDDSPSIIQDLDKNIDRLSDQLIDLFKLKAEYELHNLLRRKLTNISNG